MGFKYISPILTSDIAWLEMVHEYLCFCNSLFSSSTSMTRELGTALLDTAEIQFNLNKLLHKMNPILSSITPNTQNRDFRHTNVNHNNYKCQHTIFWLVNNPPIEQHVGTGFTRVRALEFLFPDRVHMAVIEVEPAVARGGRGGGRPDKRNTVTNHWQESQTFLNPQSHLSSNTIKTL